MPDLTQLGVDLEPTNIKLQVEHKFQDVVNRLSWNHVAFSSTGEFVTASTFMNPDIYVWERSHGSLVKILEGPREELGVVEWHPSRPMVVACGLESGCIYTWSIVSPQKWSALAPDFGEVEENVEYIEREDEFDVHTAEEVHQRRLDQEDEVPDVLTVEPMQSAADEDEDVEPFHMPVLLDISDSESGEDIIAVGPGTMRKRSPGAGRENGGDSEATTGKGGSSSRGQKGRRRWFQKICYWFGLPLYHYTLLTSYAEAAGCGEEKAFVHGIPKEGFIWAFGCWFYIWYYYITLRNGLCTCLFSLRSTWYIYPAKPNSHSALYSRNIDCVSPSIDKRLRDGNNKNKNKNKSSK